MQGVPDTVSSERARGIRVIDMSRPEASEVPRHRADVPRFAHAHGRDRSERRRATSTSTSPVPPECARRASSPGCSGALPEEDPNSALFRIEVIQVPLAHPEQAHIVSSPRIFDNLAAPAKHGEMPADIRA